MGPLGVRTHDLDIMSLELYCWAVCALFGTPGQLVTKDLVENNTKDTIWLQVSMYDIFRMEVTEMRNTSINNVSEHIITHL